MISLNETQRGQVVREVKRAHLYPVSRDEPPFRVGERHALTRTLLDPDERDRSGKYVNRNADGTPKPDPPECHVVITSIEEVPLADLVQADAKAMGFERITDVKRWWLDERRPSWRSVHGGAGAHIDAQTVQEVFRIHLAAKTAWFVRWEVDRVIPTRYLPSSVGPPSSTAPAHLRSAGPVVPDGYMRQVVIDCRDQDDERRREAARDDAEKAIKLMEQVDALFKGEHVPPAEKRRHRARHRRTMHFLEQDVRGIVERAKA